MLRTTGRPRRSPFLRFEDPPNDPPNADDSGGDGEGCGGAPTQLVLVEMMPADKGWQACFEGIILPVIAWGTFDRVCLNCGSSRGTTVDGIVVPPGHSPLPRMAVNAGKFVEFRRATFWTRLRDLLGIRVRVVWEDQSPPTPEDSGS